MLNEKEMTMNKENDNVNNDDLESLIHAIDILDKFCRYHRDTLVKDLIDGLYLIPLYAEAVGKHYGIKEE